MDFEEAKDLFVSKKNIIDQVIKKNCFKNNLSLDVADDFTSNVYEKLMEDSCRKIREFKGNSSFKTYISVIIFRIFEDKKRTWGRWKPSREALRYGPEAVKLEQLVFRDNNTGEQAYDALTADPEFSITRERAFEILEKLERKHLKRRKRHEIELSDELSDDRTLAPDEILIGDEELSHGKQLSYIINDIRGSFSAEDSLVLRMRFEGGINISEIARGLNVERSYIDKKVKMMLKKFKDEILKRKQ